MSAILFKDFNKEVKDLFTKNFQDPGQWKLESKFKGPKDQLYINPQASNDRLSVDLQYSSKKNDLSAAVRVDSNSSLGSAKVVHEQNNRMTELAWLPSSSPSTTADIHLNYHFTHPVLSVQSTSLLSDYLSSTVGLTCRVEERVLAGLSVNFDPFRSGLKDYTVALMFKERYTVTASPLSGYGLSFLHPLCAKANALVQLSLRRGNKVDGEVGVNFVSRCGGCGVAKVSIPALDVALNLAKPMSDGWLVAVTLHWKHMASFPAALGFSVSREL